MLSSTSLPSPLLYQLVMISSIIDVKNKVLKITIPGSEVIDIPLDPEEKETKTWKLFVSISSSAPRRRLPSLTFVRLLDSASPTSNCSLLPWTGTSFLSTSFKRSCRLTVQERW